MLKILGSVLILTASVGGCLTFLERFREEERQLLAMKEMLIIFEKQLEYVRLPIAEAVTDMAKKAGAPWSLRKKSCITRQRKWRGFGESVLRYTDRHFFLIGRNLQSF